MEHLIISIIADEHHVTKNLDKRDDVHLQVVTAPIPVHRRNIILDNHTNESVKLPVI